MPQQVDFLLIVRGLAALSVIYWHLGGYQEIQNYWSSFFIIPGRLAVWIFFMMSGYLIGYGLIYGKYRCNGRDLGRFYINRLLRIYPIFLFVSLVALLFAYRELTIDADFVLRELLMLQWNHGYQLNSVFWTLGVEVHFYLIAPLLVFGARALFRQTDNWSIALYLTVLLAVWGYSKSELFVSWDMRSIIGGITHFVVGILCASQKDRIARLAERKYFGVVVGCLVLVLIARFNHSYSIDLKATLLSNLIGVGLIFLHIMLEARKLSVNPFVRILLASGVLFYGIYAWHGLLIVNQILVDSLVLHTIATIVLAYMSYLIVERPLLSLKQ